MCIVEETDDPRVAELRAQCFKGAKSSFYDANVSSIDGKLEITAMYLRLCCEYMKYDLFHLHNKLKKGWERPEELSRKNAEAWWKRDNGIGEYVDSQQKMFFGIAAEVGNKAVHPQTEEVLSMKTVEMSMQATSNLYEWWAEKYHPNEGEVASRMDRMGTPEESPAEEATEEAAPEEAGAGEEGGLVDLVKTALRINGGERDWVSLTSLITSIGIIRPGFSVRREGYHTAHQMMMSKEIGKEIMVARDGRTEVLVKFRGPTDPMPSWAYNDVSIGLIIKDAIFRGEDLYGWAYMRDLDRLIKEFFPDFKIANYGHRRIRNLVRNMGLHSVEITFDHYDTRVRISPVRFLSFAIMALPNTSNQSPWANLEELGRLIRDDEKHNRASPDFNGFRDLAVFSKAYPQYFEYLEEVDGGPAVRIRDYKGELVGKISSSISELANNEGWVKWQELKEKLKEIGIESSDYGFERMNSFALHVFEYDDQHQIESVGARIRMAPQGEAFDYEAMTVPELRGISRDRGLSGYSKLRKAELIGLIESSEEEE